MTLDDLPFDVGAAPANPAAPAPRKCRRHAWERNPVLDAVACARCHKPRDEERSKRNARNGKRGRSDELRVANIVGGRKVGPLGLPWDVECPGYLRLQAKQLDRWPSLAKVIEWLDAIPATPELRGVTLADTPGSGHTTRRLIVFDLTEWAAWHGRGQQ